MICSWPPERGGTHLVENVVCISWAISMPTVYGYRNSRTAWWCSTVPVNGGSIVGTMVGCIGSFQGRCRHFLAYCPSIEIAGHVRAGPAKDQRHRLQAIRSVNQRVRCWKFDMSFESSILPCSSHCWGRDGKYRKLERFEVSAQAWKRQ